MLVYGINYSEQIENKKNLIINSHRTGRALGGGLIGLIVISDPTLNNKGSTVKLINEISESNRELANVFNKRRDLINAVKRIFKSLGDIQNEVEGRMFRSAENTIKEIEEKIEILHKQDCRMM